MGVRVVRGDGRLSPYFASETCLHKGKYQKPSSIAEALQRRNTGQVSPIGLCVYAFMLNRMHKRINRQPHPRGYPNPCLLPRRGVEAK